MIVGDEPAAFTRVEIGLDSFPRVFFPIAIHHYKFEKPIIFYNIEKFWDPFLEMLKAYEKKNLFYPETMVSFKVVDTVQDLMREVRA